MNELIAYMQQLGYSPDLSKFALDGRIHRFDNEGKKDGWLVGYNRHTRNGENYVVATFGSWKTGRQEEFKTDMRFSKEDKLAIKLDIEKAKKTLATEKIARQEEAAKNAEAQWNTGSNNPASDYISNKQLQGLYGAKTSMGYSGRELLIPMLDIHKKIWGIQRILPDGSKFFMEGQRKEACFHVIPDFSALAEAEIIYLVEGFATGASVYDATLKPTIVAFDAGNLLSVAKALKIQYLNKLIIVCGDDDRFSKKADGSPINIGREAAENVASAIGGIAIFPTFKIEKEKQTDFNDLQVAEGTEEVANQIFCKTSELLKLPLPQYRPEIILNECQESEIVDTINSVLVLQNQNAPILFRREGKLIHLHKNDEDRMQMQYLNKDQLSTRLIYSAKWLKRNAEGKLVNSTISERLTKHILNAPAKGLRRLDDICNLPYFNSSLELVSTQGYHQSDFIYLDSKILLPEKLFNNKISKEDLRSSTNIISDLFCDFPFATEADKANFLATLFFPLVRRMYDGATPLFFINATRPNTGKTLLAELVWMILIGTEPTYLGWPDSEAEQEKLISSAFMSGDSIFFFDNLRSGRLDSSVLAKVGTQTIWSGRLLGGNEMLKCPNNVLWLFTVNNLSASTELTRRSPRIRLESPLAANAKRDLENFKFPNIKEWVRKNRIHILTALYSIVKNWIDSGNEMPTHKRYLPSFEGWSHTIGGIFEAANIEGFLERQDEYSEAIDDETSSMEGILNIWWEIYKDKPLRPSEILNNNEIRELFVEMLNITQVNALLASVGIKLKEWDGRLLGDFKVTIAKDGGRSKGRLYKLIKMEEEVAYGQKNHKSKQKTT